MNINEQESGEVNVKSGDKVAKVKKLPKSHKDYWKTRMVKLGHKEVDGEEASATMFSVRLGHKNRREYFNLGTANKSDATGRAKEIYTFLIANGWEDTLAKYKPTGEVLEIETVADLIKQAEEVGGLSPKTRRNYSNSLRRLAGGIAKIKSDKSKYAPSSGSDWQVKTGQVKLASMTAEKIQKWRVKQFAGLNPKEKKTKEISVDSILNQSRSIWKHSGMESPFAGIKWKQTTRRFKPTVDAQSLLFFAMEELQKKEVEQFKAFYLCVFLGLRRAEADCLTWEQIDFDGGVVKIEPTEYFKPKGGTERSIPMTDNVLATISKWRKGADKVFVLNGGEARPDSEHADYRADKAWKPLLVWLRSKGVESSHPLHYLRKLAGSLMYAANDIYAAQQFLGHSDIRTTIGSYVDGGRKTFDLQPVKPEPKAVEAS